MSITLNQTRIRPDDTSYEVEMIGANYAGGRVIVRVRFGSGDTQDIIYEGQRLLDLRNNVSQFNGLRNAVEAYVAATEPGLGGS